MGLTAERYGQIVSWRNLVAIIPFLIMGPIADRYHPLRAGIGAGIALMLTAFACFFFIHGERSFEWMVIAVFAAVAVYQAATGAIGPRLLPRDKYGQFSSANSVVWQIGWAIASTLCGLFLDHTTRLDTRTGIASHPENYQYLFIWVGSFFLAGVIFSLALFKHWKRVAGLTESIMSVQRRAQAGFPATEPTAASLAWTSDDPKVVQGRQWILQGKFSQTERLLSNPHIGTDAVALEARKQMLEIIRRIRIDYSYSAQDVVDAAKDQLPGITLEMVQRWQKAGEVQSRLIDGNVCYFSSEPSNLLRFCAEAKAMQQPRPATQQTNGQTNQWTLPTHLQHVIDAAAKQDSPYVLPVRHTFKYTLTVPATATGMKPGALVRVWLPFPQEFGRRQYDIHLESASPGGSQLAPVGTPQRTLYFEQRVGAELKPMQFTEVVTFISAAYYPQLDPAKALPLPADYHEGNLGQRPPHIEFTPELMKTVQTILGSETNPLINARKIYYWIAQNVAYNSEEEYCTIPSFSRACFNRRRGDCGIQSTLFITMARIAGIPARWQSGWETKPDDLSIHDWAEMYIAPWGWLPVDHSYGLQDSADPKLKDFYIGHLDSYRMIVNTNWGEPLVPAKESLRSEPADFQRGEVEIDGQNLYFDQWKRQAQWSWETKP
jgi:hypothetical protein